MNSTISKSRRGLVRRLGVGIAAVAASMAVFAGPTTAAPAAPAQPTVDWNQAAQQLRAAAAGNPTAEAAMDRLLTAPKQELRQDVALPAQVFQIPAYSQEGRMDGVSGQVYGSGIALGIGGFRLGVFGGPGVFAPSQAGARMEVLWVNLSTGKSGTAVLSEHTDSIFDTTLRSADLSGQIGKGTVVAGVYGSAWHRWPVPVDDAHKDGFAYHKAELWFPSLGAVINN
ncbi:hypothetical protein OG921_23660 [Aldersonia sp. NBC_00410]|uniref:hypothetical protein n=1 Tax=Aldersonia sp. NBC_00410 TaxID=2975954 RepID=UPI00225A507E|nr:hypothetical protein [Aldersonia sp. NBC_00410]MCX5046171.1 hypothetical protein [Aldersonia sp. NBC_00410]